MKYFKIIILMIYCICIKNNRIRNVPKSFKTHPSLDIDKPAVPLDTHMQVMQTMSTRIGGKDQTPNRALEGNVKTGSTRMTRMDPRLASKLASRNLTRLTCMPQHACRHAWHASHADHVDTHRPSRRPWPTGRT